MKHLMSSAAVLLLLGACATGTTSSQSESAPLTNQAETAANEEFVVPEKREASSEFSKFKPNPVSKLSRTTIDYEVWGDMLDAMVIYMGPSERTRSSRPAPPIGTRVIYGHESPFRLEGNKIYFSGLDKEVKEALTEYKNDLERVGNQVDIASLNRNEQLAYWLNLYNAVTIQQIALKYPVQDPAEMTIGENKELFDTVKLITIQGVPLSLNDIRTQIVYPNWSDPKVVYGFFRGDLGGPTIQSSPFTRENVGRQLDRNAREYINSLRGAYKTRNAVKVSRIYDEARPYFFLVWPSDLIRHLTDFMDLDVQAEFDFSLPLEFQSYETRVADLAGGEPYYSKSNVASSDGSAGSLTLPASALRMLRELNTKVENLKEKGKLRGRVIIVDEIPLSPSADQEDENQVK